MAYEPFQMKKSRMPTTATISILKQGVIGINRLAAEQYFKDVRYVTLHYDRDARRIGIRPEAEAVDNAYEIRGQKDKSVAQVSGGAFLRYFGIEHKETRAYPCRWNEAERLVEIELDREETK